jgi:phage host-nuclease inhibitor protein Gam
MSKENQRVIILSRESLEAKVARIIKLKLDLAGQQSGMEAVVTRVQAHFQKRRTPLLEELELLEASVQAYCEDNRKELFPEKKSIDLLVAEVGFELNPHHVEKPGKETWDKLALRMNNLKWATPYVAEGKLSVDKNALIKDRQKLTAEQWKQLGLRIEQDEQFFIRPKSEMAAPSVKEAA